MIGIKLHNEEKAHKECLEQVRLQKFNEQCKYVAIVSQEIHIIHTHIYAWSRIRVIKI